MRYSAVQENSYGVGLGQESLSTYVDESMMAATGDVDLGTGDTVEEGSMISNLPLLFANGYPTSLEKITLPELERFITFMVQCSLGHDTTDVISEPKWWPKEVKFSIPVVRPKKIYDEHEKLCYTVEPRPPTPIDIEGEPELTQDQFMDYFHMRPNNSNTNQPSTQSSGKKNALSAFLDSAQLRSSNRIRGSINLTRCPTIPFSSPAGLSLGKKSKMMTEAIQQERLDRIERYLHAPALSTSLKPKWLTKTYELDRWSVTYKPNRDKTSRSSEYVHLYNFGNYSGKPMLDLPSQLKYLSCKPIYVVVERLTDEQLEELKRDPSRYKSPERQVPQFRPRSPSIESVLSFEAEPGDESNPIEIIDLEDDDLPPSPPIPPPVPLSLLSQLSIREPIVSLTTVHHKRPQAVVAPIRPVNPPVVTRTPLMKPQTLKRPNPSPMVFAKSRNASRTITVVDLVSSDEELSEDEVSASPYGPTDDNYDHLGKKQTTIQGVPEMNMYISPNRYCGGETRYYVADSTTTWLASQHRNSYLNHSASTYDDEP
ncbi:uncharacterized protein LOC106640567 [Copidosoma floridanum]|uniref:uncharacterized protein LOC106640567 n=1 Tax=Copidosoma floridanum TaxID=29053 RepID=UPI0006C9C10C|nr:uncharacterized protein LOC106640567 [Copidosoma floridanum]